MLRKGCLSWILDMRKAFDFLIIPCFEYLHHLGICSTEIQWFSSYNYLSDCVQQVNCNHSYFGWGHVLWEIPQGSLPKLVPRTTFAAKVGPAGPILAAKTGPPLPVLVPL